TPHSVAYAILDSRLLEIRDYQRAIRSEIAPVRAETLSELARLVGVNGDNLERTVAVYNASCTGDPAKFDATRCDGLAASGGLSPPKSNWARAIIVPPFVCYPLSAPLLTHSAVLQRTTAPASCGTARQFQVST